LSLEDFDEFSFNMEPVESDVNNNEQVDMNAGIQLLDGLVRLLPREEQVELDSVWGDLNEQPLGWLWDLTNQHDDLPAQEVSVQPAIVEEATGAINMPTVELTNSGPTLMPTVVQQPTTTPETIFDGLIETVNINGEVVHIIAVDSSWTGERPGPSRGRPRKVREKLSPYETDKSKKKKLQDKESSRKYRDNKRAQEAKERIDVLFLEKKNKDLKAEVDELELKLKEFESNL